MESEIDFFRGRDVVMEYLRMCDSIIRAKVMENDKKVEIMKKYLPHEFANVDAPELSYIFKYNDDFYEIFDYDDIPEHETGPGMLRIEYDFGLENSIDIDIPRYEDISIFTQSYIQMNCVRGIVSDEGYCNKKFSLK